MTKEKTPTIGHNSEKERAAILQAEALEQVKIEAARVELTKRQAESMDRVEGTGVGRKAFREIYAELKRSRNQKAEHIVAREITMEALNAMEQGELWAVLDGAKAAAKAAKEEAAEARKAKVAKAKKGTAHPSADAKDAAAKRGESVSVSEGATIN